MLNTKYTIDLYSDFDQGGYCAFYTIKSYTGMAFKEFISKSRAEYARKIQLKLSRFNLAPKVHTPIIKMKYDLLFPNKKSGWGFITEIAKPIDDSVPLSKIQRLVDEIYLKTKLKFWDCHWYNMGLIKRGRSKKLVCIDTGKESFDGYSNAWGNPDPGPKCSYCNTYECKCEDI